MEEKTTIQEAQGNPAAETGPAESVIRLKKPYRFEQRDYTEIELSGLARLTVKDAVDAQRELANHGETAALMVCETTTAFARELAARASGMPIEFFKLLPRGISRRVTLEVRKFFDVESRTEGHVMRLEKPYYFDGEEYREIDLNGLAELNSMNESAAENRIAREGFLVTETSFNFLYACCLAGMACGKPIEFFTGLPLCEAVKLKNAVNDGDFFE